ncbi:type I restriction-modification system subunit M [Carboxydothermus pertinax]|uniref:site-specific DNA-methyltransferase (adenine-specific) n=1 Tax=Carboxydothermus pertinax TaxID=870242 RepID=A0A1L8CSG3_9THEO|nr:class I SAM-dependent DNA methyltransferase [Carboxydothermus pertinax]GAV21853.1 N-6 DNA methylase [Carboxydothermus pertinax]
MGQNNDGVLEFASVLWATADRLRNNMEPSEYKHIVLGLIFLKYISDAFKERQEELQTLVKDPGNPDYYCVSEEEAQYILEDKDEYLAANAFYVPPQARYEYLMANAQRSDIGKLIDEAMDLIEKENPKYLRGVLPKVYTRAPLDPHTLGEIVNLIGSIGFKKNEERDILGRVYEYFLTQFAKQEGKGGGQFFTPECVVKLLVEMIEPLHGRVFDPCCGSGGMFVQSMRFVEAHAGKKGDISVYGQESNPTTYRLCKMNLAIRGIEADIRLGNSYIDDQFKDLRADYILANPPFNDSAWGANRVADDVRWKYGLPPDSNANYAWIQHFIYHLAPNGVAGFVLANGSMTTSNSAEYEIRKRIIEENLVDCMVALPPQLFYTTGIPACLWFIRKGRKTREILFIDARKMGIMVDRTHRELTCKEIKKIAQTYHSWRNKKGYEDVKGFCASVPVEIIAQNDYVLAPGRYVGVEDTADDGIPFEEKMAELVEKLYRQMKEAKRLDEIIKANLEELGYGE